MFYCTGLKIRDSLHQFVFAYHFQILLIIGCVLICRYLNVYYYSVHLFLKLYIYYYFGAHSPLSTVFRCLQPWISLYESFLELRLVYNRWLWVIGWELNIFSRSLVNRDCFSGCNNWHDVLMGVNWISIEISVSVVIDFWVIDFMIKYFLFFSAAKCTIFCI